MIKKKNKPLGGKIITVPILICSALVLIAVLLIAKRFVFGLGSVTNMSDSYPWGIWIAYDVVVGTAFACGGYAMAILVYVLNKREYHSLIRSALLASMFGYTLAGASIFIDIGRYWHMYNLFLPWYSNVNSILLEVALCIGTYVFVLWIEFSPVFLEGYDGITSSIPPGFKKYIPSFLVKFRSEVPLKTLNKILFVFIALGMLLPTMHQSSLGTLMVIAGYKVYPLWQTNFLPLLFLISAVMMGYAVVIFESTLSSIGLKGQKETHLLSKISIFISYLIGVYLVVRFGDIILRGQIVLVFKGDLKGNMFILENLLYLLPMIFLMFPKIRGSSIWLFILAISVLLAGALYRFNVYLVGFDPGTGAQRYFPSISEIMITLGIVSIEIIGYIVFIKRLPVLESEEHSKGVK